MIHGLSNNYPIKNYRGLSPNYRGERWAVCSFHRRCGQLSYNLPITHLWITSRSLQVCFLRILISEASTNKKYEDKMHIEASETIFLRLFQ